MIFFKKTLSVLLIVQLISTSVYATNSANNTNTHHLEVVNGSINFIDSIRSILTIPFRTLLLNQNIGSGNLSQDKINNLVHFLKENNVENVVLLNNTYDPKTFWKKVYSNPNTSLLSKIFIGTFEGIRYTIIPDTLFGYDRFSYSGNTIIIQSDDLTTAMLLGSEAKEFRDKKYPTLFAITKSLLNELPLLNIIGLGNFYFDTKVSARAYNYLHKFNIQTKETARLLFSTRPMKWLLNLCSLRAAISLGMLSLTTEFAQGNSAPSNVNHFINEPQFSATDLINAENSGSYFGNQSDTIKRTRLFFKWFIPAFIIINGTAYLFSSTLDEKENAPVFDEFGNIIDQDINFLNSNH